MISVCYFLLHNRTLLIPKATAHGMKVYGEWRYSSEHSQSRQQREVSSQFQAPAALAIGKESMTSIVIEAGWDDHSGCAV
jgi:hypothetical protein